MYGLFMTLALTFFLSTEMEELSSHPQGKVQTLERDVNGLESIVLDLDSKHRRLGKQYGSLDKRFERLDNQVVHIYLAAGWIQNGTHN